MQILLIPEYGGEILLRSWLGLFRVYLNLIENYFSGPHFDQALHEFSSEISILYFPFLFKHFPFPFIIANVFDASNSLAPDQLPQVPQIFLDELKRAPITIIDSPNNIVIARYLLNNFY